MPGPVSDPTIVKIIDISQSKDDAFLLSMRWLSETYVSSKAVIDYSDKEAGTINGKGMAKVTLGFLPVNITYSIIIDVKDQKARLTFRALSNDVDRFTSSRVFDLFKVSMENLTADYISFLSSKKADSWPLAAFVPN